MIFRIEYIHEKERLDLIKNIKEDYLIVEESKISPSKKQNSKKKIQFIEIEKRI